MITPTVWGQQRQTRQIGAGQSRIGPQHGEHDKLRRRHAETGQRSFQRQPRGGLSLPQQIGEVALFAAHAPARRRRSRACEIRTLRAVFRAARCSPV
jgi:hypothetical protein